MAYRNGIMAHRTGITIAAVVEIVIGFSAQAFAQVPNFPIRNYAAVLGDLSAFFSGNPNAPIGGLLDQHARWHHLGVPGGRTIAPGQPGSGVEFLRFHRQFVANVYDAGGGTIVDNFNQVTPWTRVPDALRAQSGYPATAESRLLNNSPAFATEDEFGIFLEQNLHNWIHGAAATAFGDNVIGDPHHSPQSRYFYQIHGLVNYLWSLYFPQNCQAASDLYSIQANVTFGFAPPPIQQWWKDNNCQTNPIRRPLFHGSFACQTVSNLYNTQASITFAAAPNNVQQWWIANSCNTQPTVVANTCSTISDTFGTWANVAWAAAPAEVQTVWKNGNCVAQPDLCQRVSDLYGTAAWITWGTAPSDVRAFWSANGCNTNPRWRF